MRYCHSGSIFGLAPLATGVAATLALSAIAGCAHDPGERNPADTGTTGQTLFGVLCDRMGAQALSDDLTGASFRSICHLDASGTYATDGAGVALDESQLPPVDEAGTTPDGKPISAAARKKNRQHAIDRMAALARRRADLVAALEAAFPEQTLTVKDVTNSDPAHSCDPAPAKRKLSAELADLLGRFTGLYNDGTIPSTTESLAQAFAVLSDADTNADAQAAVARMQARQGYRPSALTLGSNGPTLAYPNLRDFLNAYLALLAPDSAPYDPAAKKDAQGDRIPVAGSAHDKLVQMVHVAHHEMLYATADPPTPATVPVTDPLMGRTVLPKPRTDLEMLQQLSYLSDPSFVVTDGAGKNPVTAPHPIVLRDPRGHAQVYSATPGTVPAPFVDQSPRDGLADLDDLGQFVTKDGSLPPPPFVSLGLPSPRYVDACGRPTRAAGTGSSNGSDVADGCGQPPSNLYYRYLDTTHVSGASLLNDLRALSDPDPAHQHATFLYALAGATVLAGNRNPAATKCYAPGASGKGCSDPASNLTYDAFDPDSSALLDLIWAVGQILGDGPSDDLLRVAKHFFVKDTPADPDLLNSTARTTGAALAMKAIADKATIASPIPEASTIWDDLLGVLQQVAAVPGLLEDVIRSTADDRTVNLGKILATYMSDKDLINYDPAHLNGPAINLTKGNAAVDIGTPVDRAKADTGDNRSVFQRFTQLIHDSRGVTICNKDQATVNSIIGGNIPIAAQNMGVPFKECEVFKVNDLGSIYVQSIVGKATLNFRNAFIKSATTVQVTEDSSGITGFWDPGTSAIIRPKPQWLARETFFDQANDTQNPQTKLFLSGLNGPFSPTSLCAARIIDDPVQDADTAPDKKVHLRTCQDGQWLNQRDPNTLFVFEQLGFFDAITPLVTAFTNHDQVDLFNALQDSLFKHWALAPSPSECLLGTDASGKPLNCSKDGADQYEPIVAAQLATTEIFSALHDATKQMAAVTITHCDQVGPGGLCAKTSTLDGVKALANAAIAMLDPAHAAAIHLTDRKGNQGTKRNDGVAVPQVTPAYLLVNALKGFDTAFEAANDKKRQTLWKTARSQLVDQFLTVDGTGASAAFHNPSAAKVTPKIIDVLREQAFAHCQGAFTTPNATCDWARTALTKQAATTLGGPLFAATLDLLEAIRLDDPATTETNKLLQYLLTPTAGGGSGGSGGAVPGLLASSNDLLQVLGDDTNLVPLYHVLAHALDTPTAPDGASRVNGVDANLNLLGRIGGRAPLAKGTGENCSVELDPNQVVTLALTHLVTPPSADAKTPVQTPLEVILDVIGDVNRAAPADYQVQPKLRPEDYGAIAENVTEFLLDPQRGLEQFYEIVKQGTRNE